MTTNLSSLIRVTDPDTVWFGEFARIWKVETGCLGEVEVSLSLLYDPASVDRLPTLAEDTDILQVYMDVGLDA